MGHGLTVKSEAQFCKWKRLQSNGQCMWEVHKLRVSTSNLTKCFSVSDHLHIASIYIHTSLTYPGRLFLCFNSIWLQYTLVSALWVRFFFVTLPVYHKAYLLLPRCYRKPPQFIVLRTGTNGLSHSGERALGSGAFWRLTEICPVCCICLNRRWAEKKYCLKDFG